LRRTNTYSALSFIFRTKVPSFFKTHYNSEDNGENQLIYSLYRDSLIFFSRLSTYGAEVKIRLTQESGRDFKAVNESPLIILLNSSRVLVSLGVEITNSEGVECHFFSIIAGLMESAGGIPGVIWMQSCQEGLAVLARVSGGGLRMVNGCY